ncbi:CBO0543 family protein [Paenibacillus methanolicus]|uniref:CBO0543 family protein n=1 Tax=Paenibacillus methanolicus TaxID=582686 RepID=UPI003CCC7A79
MRGQLLLASFTALIISSWLDFNGVILGLWYYTGLAIPTIPSYVPWDFCLLPVLIMFLIQVKPQLSAYWKAAIFRSLV